MKIKFLFSIVALCGAMLLSDVASAQDFTIFNATPDPLIGTVYSGPNGCSPLGAPTLQGIPAGGSFTFVATNNLPNQYFYVQDLCGNGGVSGPNGCGPFTGPINTFTGCNRTYVLYWINSTTGWIL